MKNVNSFEVLFESITDYKKLLIVSIKDDKKLSHEIGSRERDVNRLNVELKEILLEQHENYLEFVKDPEESIIEKILKK